MWGSIACVSTRLLRHFPPLLPRVSSSPTTLLTDDDTITARSSFASFASRSNPNPRGRDMEMKSDRERSRGRGGGRGGGGGSGKDKIDALGRLMTRILRHMASELNLSMRSDGFVKVNDILQLNMKTFAHIPLRSHTIDDVREAVRKDNKQRFSLLEENGELFIRANQGHTVTTVETERLLQAIVSAEEVPVCVHGTYRKNLESILQSGLKQMKRLHVHFSRGLPTDGEVVSGIRRNVEVLIYLDVKKALEEGMKLYISDNKVILSEGIDGVIPVKYFEKIESWPDRKPIPFLSYGSDQKQDF
ncbi:uncharacterized protein LOC133819526 isoform X2 [Humulus lupulus]|uniref:uncharacterized protein LOC133819526 isoform X2 n=1 Tax=Humulus lupulus TaxID=3486 RepID=UPI002B407A60|nr:uncharacterized protein LOC133819526 isoform X2 [Humulus lupulus]